MISSPGGSKDPPHSVLWGMWLQGSVRVGRGKVSGPGPAPSVHTCFSAGCSLLHSAPSILVISGKGRSGWRVRICSRRSFRKRT